MIKNRFHQQKTSKEICKDSQQNQIELIEKFAADFLINLNQLLNVQMQKFGQICGNNEKNESEWKRLADNFEVFCLVIFLFANAFITIVFVAVGYSKM